VPEALIHLESVTKVFVTDEVETHALAGIHLDINKVNTWRSRVVGLREVDAAGDSGPARFLERRQIRTERRPVQGLKLSERAPHSATARSASYFQAFNLIGDLTVFENVELPLTYRGMPGSERKKRVHEALERVAWVTA